LNEEHERRSLLIFAKSPEPGQVKTRIAQQVGPDKAAAIYEEMLNQILQESAAEKRWERILFITPESDSGYFHRQGLRTRVQQGNDLGERMGNAFLESWKLGMEKVVLIGSDIPSLTQGDIAAAFEMLARVPAVIGPSEDGGFYLFGLTKKYLPQAKDLFCLPIPWSTPEVLAEVEKKCRDCQLTLGYLPKKADIDTYEDWIRYQNTR